MGPQGPGAAMRANIFAALALTALLMIPAAVVAHDGRAQDARAAAEERKAADHGNETRDDNATRERNDTRPPAVRAFHEGLRALHASWHENLTKVRQDCRAEAFDKDNSTRGDRLAYAHCVRDAHKTLHATYVAEIRELRAEWRAAMRDG